MQTLLWWVVALVILWVVARLFLAVTSFALYLLLIIAGIMLIVWLVQRFAG